MKLCDCFSGGLGLLQQKSVILWTELNICCFLQEELCSHRTLLNLREKLLQARKKPIYFISKDRAYTICTYTHTHMSVHTDLVMLQFSFQAVQAVENKFFVQLIVGVTDKPPHCFSFGFEVLPGAQSCLEMMT